MTITTKQAAPPNTHEAVDELLVEVVRRVTGLDNPEPRPGQIALAHETHKALQEPVEYFYGGERPNWEKHHTVGIAPTGTGKAIAGLVPAALQACQGKRTIFSTESLSLQNQIMDKDFPVVAAATAAIHGYRPSIALHKGFANYVCLRAAAAHTVDSLNIEDINGRPVEQIGGTDLPGLLKTELSNRALAAHMSGVDVDLTKWALEQAEPGATGDKSEYDGTLDHETWQNYSVSSEDCIGADCPFFEICLPHNARQRASEADIVVTNHALLGVQAAKQVPVIVGSKKLGDFDGIVVDEAHALPGWVRSQGAAVIHSGSVSSLAKRVARQTEGTAFEQIVRMADALTKDLEADLEAAVREAAPKGPRPGEALEVKPLDALPNSGDSIIAWCDALEKMLKDAMDTVGNRASAWLPFSRLASRAAQLRESVRDLREGNPHIARWLMAEARNSDDTPAVTASLNRRGRGRPTQQVDLFIKLEGSPVDVSALLKSSLWAKPVEEEVEASLVERGLIGPATEGGAEVALKATMGVVAMSATMPIGYGRQAGLSGRTQEFESPFTQAYANSVAYVPDLTAADATQITRSGGKGMDTKQHHEWAKPKIVDLVRANGGSALVLAATSANGKGYADALRVALAGTGIRVYSQWDGVSMRQIVSDWRDDVTSVLVGTRSMMTGVDAPGRTCSLVILDRIPRSAGNPVDDARVALMVDEQVCDNKWEGDRLVYVADARLLMEQALGRLIRSINDVGMAAVLDPRLLKQAGRLAYNDQTRKLLVKPLVRFPNRLTSHDEALEWLQGNAAAHNAAVGAA